MATKVEELVSDIIARRLVGELLTIIDASYNDKIQREAVKSLVRQSCQKALLDLNCQFQRTLLELNCQLEVIVTKQEQNK